MKDAIRSRFEAWAREEPRYFNICRSGEDYYYPAVQDAWIAWQSAFGAIDGLCLLPVKADSRMLMAGHKNGGESVSCGMIWDAMVKSWLERR